MASSLLGFWYRLEPFSGLFKPLGPSAYGAASSPGDNTVCVYTPGADTEPVICQQLNSGAAVMPTPLGGRRWKVLWATLKAASAGSPTALVQVTGTE